MTKMIKMDLYRFFRSASTWAILFADIMLAFLSVMLVSANKSIQIYSNAGELLAAQINGGMLMILYAAAIIIFVSAKYKDGFIKNIANQLPRREMLVLPEIIVSFVACALHFFVYSIGTITAGAVFFGNTFTDFSFFAIMKLLIVQFILHWAFCCLMLLFYILTGSTAFTVAAGLLIAFKMLNGLYVLVEKYVADLETYWSDNKPVFKLDSVSFLYIWGSLITWAIITLLCFIIGILSYAKLPSEIPVQWDNGIVTSVVDKKFIFVYPFACICIRILLRPVIYVRFLMNYIYGELITEYLSNYLCFIALSVEVFSIMFVYGLIKSVVAVLLVDTVALIGILIVGITKVSLGHSPAFK